MPSPQTASRSHLLLFLLFGLSGFSGLIYESVWTHYIKLFLGHAAYAQTLVLAMFMGGMGLGAWLASRYSHRWQRPLVLYAIVEGVIGLAALGFHFAFVAATDFAFDHVIPSLPASGLVYAAKWGLAATFVLPQSILLGMTFPLMSTGVIRRDEARPGAALSILYFSNSLGAAVGVLTAGFFLISIVGLPGAMLTAGLLNIAVALAVWLLVKDGRKGQFKLWDSEPSRANDRWVHLILVAALMTGAASFAYEIAWIRMLSLVLGSSTHSFELMLSAFILGLALGGLWIRRRIDSLSHPVRFLGYVQVVMGLLALLTLPVYDYTFYIMQEALGALAPSDSGYDLFNIVSHATCLLVMLPTTFCAGITLPLMTLILLRKGNGERAIGAVYSFNTIGAILGVLATVHVVMPAMGMKGALIAGAALDIGLALVLLAPRVSQTGRLALAGVVTSVVIIGGLTTVLGDLDPRKLMSGVFRVRVATLPPEAEVVYRRDGKTASIGVMKFPDGSLNISTNGKTDAALTVSGGSAKPDEPTMALAAALPMAIHPHARLAANIGFGSGLTSHVLLSTGQLRRLDTVEIEPLMVEGARHFGTRNSKVYSDPRSRIHIEDAKTFFSAQRERYDIIVSEPSNPWVSGVSSLFSEQFYARMTRHLAHDGVFVQWVQLYEIEEGLIASIMKALAPHFEDYAVYTSNDTDMLVVARRTGRLGDPDAGVLSEPGLAAELNRVGVLGAHDLVARKIGSKRTLEWMFDSYGEPANSDYFPYVDQNAARSRYLNLNALALARLTTHPLPLLEMLDGPNPQRWSQRTHRTEWLRRSHTMARASAIRDAIAAGKATLAGEHANVASHLLPLMLLDRCDSVPAEGVWSDAWLNTAMELVPYVSPEELEAVWRRVETRTCYALLPDSDKKWFELTRAAGRRDAEAMARLAQVILERDGPKPNLNKIRYAVVSGMLGNIVNGYPGQAFLLWSKHGQEIFPLDDLPLDARLLFALSGRPSEKSQTALEQQLAKRKATAQN